MGVNSQGRNPVFPPSSFATCHLAQGWIPGTLGVLGEMTMLGPPAQNAPKWALLGEKRQV